MSVALIPHFMVLKIWKNTDADQNYTDSESLSDQKKFATEIFSLIFKS